MSKRISQILEVLALLRNPRVRDIDEHAVAERRISASKQIAHNRRINYKTVSDKLRRQLEPNIAGVREFDRLVQRWLNGSADKLQSVLLLHAVNEEDEALIRGFFAAKST